jgi:hypothetical protein
MRFRGAPRMQTRKTRTGSGSRPTRAAFPRPAGTRLPSRPPSRSRTATLHALSRLFRDMSLQPRTAASSKPAEAGKPTGPAMQPLLGFGALRHSPGPAESLEWRRVPPPPRATCEVWIPPWRLATTDPPGAQGAGASMGFTLQGVPFVARGASLEVPALLTLPVRRRGRLQGLVPTTNPFCRPTTARAVEPSMPSWVSPLQSILPSRPGDRL